MAEVLLPGNPALLERVIEALLAAGDGRLRRAEAGEFTARAFLNGRLDLVQAEGTARLIAARTEAEREAAERLLSGRVGARYAGWADRLATLLALTEAGIDFTDQEDVVPLTPADLAGGLEHLIEEMGAVIALNGPSESRGHRPRVVLVGAPNAGKSTLFNALLGCRRAVVSEVAGSTRDVLAEPLDLAADVPGGPVVELCDVAGLEGDEGTRTAMSQAARAAIGEAVVVVVCEPEGWFERIGSDLAALIGNKARINVRTKGDLPGWGGAGGSGQGLPVCALDGWGVPQLRRAIADAAAGAIGTAAAAEVLPRHREAISRACVALRGARRLIDARARSLRSPEIVAATMRGALDTLGEIAGRSAADDILGRIFATFCVGK